MPARNPFKKIAEDAAAKTNAEMKDELARLIPFTEAELQKVLPRKADKEHFAELMAIVNSSAATNTKLAQLRANIDSVGGVILKVMGALS